MFGLWKSWRRKRLLLRQPKQESLQAFQRIWQWKSVSYEIRRRAIEWSTIFVAEKHWEGCQGFRITDAVKWTIAGQAALLTVAYPNWFFDHTLSILVYPSAYWASNHVEPIGSGVAIHGQSAREGEAWYRGPVILNWEDIEASVLGPNDGHCLVVHEFSHQIDMVNGSTADGIPPLPTSHDETRWKTRLQGELSSARQLAETGHNLLINDYGLTRESEFFAVASELYYQLPHELARFHPGVFQLLDDFYQCDWRRFH